VTVWIHFAVAGVTEVLWVPILLRFIRAWRERKNPISLSIVVLILFMMILSLSPFWILHYNIDTKFIMAVNELLSLIVVTNFYVAFRFAGAKFKSTRGGV
jgi:hypothetical protein